MEKQMTVHLGSIAENEGVSTLYISPVAPETSANDGLKLVGSGVIETSSHNVAELGLEGGKNYILTISEVPASDTAPASPPAPATGDEQPE